MAESPSHRFGQHLGNLLERLLEPLLRSFCEEHGFYLDKKGERPGVRNGKRLSWLDSFENTHDLDFVVESEGTATTQGRPLAFVEAAWRSYTKHSKAKAQEIQGAVLPIAARYRFDRPFLGAVLAGAFTDPALTQMRSNGFNLVYMPAASVVKAFGDAGVDISYDEETPDAWFQKKLDEIQRGGARLERNVIKKLVTAHSDQISDFIQKLNARVSGQILRITIIPLYGSGLDFSSLTSALGFLNSRKGFGPTDEFRKFEIRVVYSNGDSIDAEFATMENCAGFLRSLATRASGSGRSSKPPS